MPTNVRFYDDVQASSELINITRIFFDSRDECESEPSTGHFREAPSMAFERTRGSLDDDIVLRHSEVVEFETRTMMQVLSLLTMIPWFFTSYGTVNSEAQSRHLYLKIFVAVLIVAF